MKKHNGRIIKFRAWDGHRMMAMEELLQPVEIEEQGYLEQILLGYLNYELMQFTGLHDKNGKEIYEGDICLAKDYLGKSKKVIQYDSEQGWWNFNRYLGSPRKVLEHEVIGNIYENPGIIDPKGWKGEGG